MKAAGRVWAGAALGAVLLLGVGFRVYHADRKVYWVDEVYSTIRIVGTTEGELVGRASVFRTASDLRLALHPPGQERRPISQTVSSLVREDPQHPPLYYVIAYCWAMLFGTSIAAIRSLSVVIGVATLPLMYWLCMELFGERRAAWIGAALIAVSPIFVLYSQEAREYILWVATTLWMCAALLRALRLNGANDWLAYGLSFVAGLYTYPLTLLVALANGLYILALARFRIEERFRSFLLCFFAGLAAFSPWLFTMYREKRQIEVMLSPSAQLGLTILTHKATAFHVLRRFLAEPRLAFFDVDPVRTGALQGLASLLVLALIAFSLYWIYRRMPRPSWLFIAILMFSVTVPVLLVNVMLPDRSSVPRYYFPFYVAVLLAVTGCISSGFASARTRLERAGWQLWLGAIFASCILSCTLSARAETWWTKLNDNSEAVARTMSESPRDVLLSDGALDYSLVLSNYLGDDTPVILRPTCHYCNIANAGISPADVRAAERFRSIYLLAPSTQLKREIAQTPAKGEDVRCIGSEAGADCPGNLWILPAGW